MLDIISLYIIRNEHMGNIAMRSKAFQVRITNTNTLNIAAL